MKPTKAIGLVLLAVLGVAGCMGEDELTRRPGVPLDPTCDWQPSSDWAAEGDLTDPGGPGDEDPYGSGADASAADGGGYYDSYTGRESGADADADADADGDYDYVGADADGAEDDGEDVDAEPDVVDPGDGGACDPDAEDGGDCDAVEEPADPDAGEDGGEPDGVTKSVDPEEPYVMYLSADDSNSMASPVVARWYMRNGSLVPHHVVRIYEFLNYYDIGYAPADPGTVRVISQFRPVNAEEGLYALQLGVQSEGLTPAGRRPMNLTLVLDTSGSMSGTPIELLREAVRAIAASLRGGDIVSAVEWDTERAIRLDSHAVVGPDDPTVLTMVEALAPDGGTNLHAGLELGYALARRNYRQTMMNRVVLISDGQANVGITDIHLIAAGADEMEGEGIYLVGVGCGSGYNDELMDEVTDAGRGAYVFLDTPQEARRMFVDRFLQVMEVAVRDVRVELTLPGVFRIEEFHGEEYSAIPEEVEPQHLAPNDAMVYHQILRAIRPEWVYADDVIGVRVQYFSRGGAVERTASTVDTLQALVRRPVPEMRKADALVVYAQALMRISVQVDRGERDAAVQTCESALALVGDSVAALHDFELAEVEALLEAYCPLVASGASTGDSWDW
ncbi:MAG: VWA domain-containing protein [Deltaproteobacteria bacterium]|nr:VWA domain-containing protein [Deltaproteobacteria bacterium]